MAAELLVSVPLVAVPEHDVEEGLLKIHNSGDYMYLSFSSREGGEGPRLQMFRHELEPMIDALVQAKLKLEERNAD